ncbi:MAG: hypothetical protein LM550_14180 [Candidatus Contendobacter sp.]|nr:hypothetical protein [Gammaproteobacteria bacterium]MCC8994801.1 hypothetical protein [Candidatus Contendobacter sp.]
MRGWLALPTWFWSGRAPQVRFPGLWLNAAGVEVKNWKPRKRQGFLKRLVGDMVLLRKNYKNAVLLLLFLLLVLVFNFCKIRAFKKSIFFI